jgi:hypothetical protein
MWMQAAAVVEQSLTKITSHKIVVITGWRNCCYIAIQVSDLTKLTIN